MTFEEWWDARSPKDETTVMAKMVKVYSSAAWNAALEEVEKNFSANVGVAELTAIKGENIDGYSWRKGLGMGMFLLERVIKELKEEM